MELQMRAIILDLYAAAMGCVLGVIGCWSSFLVGLPVSWDVLGGACRYISAY